MTEVKRISNGWIRLMIAFRRMGASRENGVGADIENKELRDERPADTHQRVNPMDLMKDADVCDDEDLLKEDILPGII